MAGANWFRFLMHFHFLNDLFRPWAEGTESLGGILCPRHQRNVRLCIWKIEQKITSFSYFVSNEWRGSEVLLQHILWRNRLHLINYITIDHIHVYNVAFAW
jgi:hypothetical protein